MIGWPILYIQEFIYQKHIPMTFYRNLHKQEAL